MLDALRTLFESNVVSEDVRREIEEAWESKVRENKKAVAAELREEFAQKYEYDKSIMVEAVDRMIEERLSEEIAEFNEDRKQLAEIKARYAMVMRQDSNLLRSFVVEQLQKEIRELHNDKKAMNKKYAKLEEFVVDALSNEITEFYQDKQDVVETKVKLVREAKSKFKEVKKNFVKRSSRAVAEIVSENLTREISTLKEDIELARRNDFGRKIFEAFSTEYTNSYLNEKSETAKLLKIVKLKEKQLREARQIAHKTKTLAENVTRQKKKLMESMSREKTIQELIAPLNYEQKGIMTDLLETVQTSRLQSAFDKYLPTVIGSKNPAKRKAILSEATEITGNRDVNSQNFYSRQADAGTNVFDIKRLAGLN